MPQHVKYKKAQPTEPITYYSNTYGETVQSPTGYTSTPAGATAICRDGTYSFSRNRRGKEFYKNGNLYNPVLLPFYRHFKQKKGYFSCF